MLRNDRHDHGGECVADSYADSHTYADGHADFHTYADSYADSHTYTDGYAHGHTYADSYAHGHTYADCNSYADGHTHAHGHTNANGNTDAVHGKMCTDAEAGSESRAASHATRGDSWHVHSHSERHAWASYCGSS